MATGEGFKNQMEATIDLGNGETDKIINVLVNLKIEKHNGRGEVNGGLEPLFSFYDDTLQAKLDSLISSGSDNPLTELMAEEELYMGFENVSWGAFEVTWAEADGNHTDRNGVGVDKAFWSTPYIMYGTPSDVFLESGRQFARYMFSQKQQGTDFGAINMPTNPDSISQVALFLQSNNFQNRWQWDVADTAFMLSEDFPQLGLSRYTDMSYTDRSAWATWMTSRISLGYSIQIFSLSPQEESGTPTWDRTNYPEDNYSPAPSPENTNSDGSYPEEYPSEGGEYVSTGKDHKFNIVKFYATKKKDGTYTYTQNYTRTQTVHSIQIDDEVGYTVDNWYTSPNFSDPSSNQSNSYDVWKSNTGVGTYSGTSSGNITIKATDPDTTLYIRLYETPKIDIVKYFVDERDIQWRKAIHKLLVRHDTRSFLFVMLK